VRPAVDFNLTIGGATMPLVTGKRVALVGLVLFATGVGGMWLSAGRHADAPRMAASTQPRSETSSTASGTPRAPGGALTEFRDERGGFAVSYPTGWLRPTSSDPQVAFVAAEKDPAQNQGGSALIRVTALDGPVGKEQLGEARKATDAIVASAKGVELKAEPAETEQGGLPGLYYLYTFRDPVSGQRGAHSHYFLFRGRTMISVVFQALPQDDFGRLASLFDRIAGSFRAL
jgi:hypothetical protein